MAAAPDFWFDNAVHLPQMIATGWLSLRGWYEPAGAVSPADSEGGADEPALPYLRPVLLLWLATLGESEWIALDDLAAHLAARSPAWDRLTIAIASGDGVEPAASGWLLPAVPSPSRGAAPRGRARPGPEPPRGARLLESILLGAAYPLGLVRAAEERGSGRRLVQLTPLGATCWPQARRRRPARRSSSSCSCSRTSR